MKKTIQYYLPILFAVIVSTYILHLNSYASFSDVSSDHDNFTAIQYIQDEEIVSGYPDGSFKPNSTINRAEFAKIIVESQFDQTDINDCLTDNTQSGWTYAFFPDVPMDSWFAKYVCVAKDNDVIGGYPDGSFKPSDNINFAEASKIIVNAFDYTVGTDAVWYAPFVEELSDRSAIPTTISKLDKTITRGEMAEMIYRLDAEVTDEASVTYSNGALTGAKTTSTAMTDTSSTDTSTPDTTSMTDSATTDTSATDTTETTSTPGTSATDTSSTDTSSTTSTTPKSNTLIRDFKFSLPLFSSDSAWNQKASTANVLSNSDNQILSLYRVMLGDTSSLSEAASSPNWQYMDIGYNEYSVPISRASNSTTSVPICNYEGELDYSNPKVVESVAPNYGEGGPATIPVPAGKVRPSGPQSTDADGHLVLYNPSTFIEYDMWQATTVSDGKCKSRGGGLEGTSILEAGTIDFFDVRKEGTNHPNPYYSARAAGIPLLAGLMLPEDVEAGEIKHALAFAIPAPHIVNTDNPAEGVDYFYPASRAEESFYNTDPNAIAQGQRLRMKQTLVDEEGNTIDETSLAPITRMFIKAFRTYGGYVVDNATGFSFYAEDIHTGSLDLTDDEVNQLIGKSAGTPLPSGKTKWELVIEKLAVEVELIPIAEGENEETPKNATITTSNFEVVEHAAKP